MSHIMTFADAIPVPTAVALYKMLARFIDTNLRPVTLTVGDPQNPRYVLVANLLRSRAANKASRFRHGGAT